MPQKQGPIGHHHTPARRTVGRLVLPALALVTVALAAPACSDDQDAPPPGSEVVPGEEGPVE